MRRVSEVLSAVRAALLTSALAFAAPVAASAQDALGPRLTEARDALSAGRAAQALALYDQVLAETPSDRRALLGRGVALSRLDRAEEAVALFDALIARQEDAAARYHRGVARYRLGDLDAAIADLTAARSGGLQNAVVFQRLGDAYYAKGDAAAALESYRLAATLPDHGPSTLRGLGNAQYALGDYPAARAAYDLALERDPEDGRAAYYRAWTHEMLGDAPAALADYDRAITLLPAPDADMHIARGDLLRATGALERALEDYRTALSLDPGSAAATFGLAVALLDQNRIDEALGHLDRLVAQLGENRTLGAAALLERGRARLMSGAYENAESDLTQSLRLKQDQRDAHYNRALARVGLDDLAGALEDLRRAARLDPDDADLHYTLARVATAAGLGEEALAAARRAEERLAEAEAAPARAGGLRDPEHRLGRGLAAMAFNDPDTALGIFDAILRERPDDAPALRAKTLALLKLERADEALTLARALIAAAPGDPSGHLLAADAEIARDNPMIARDALEQANRLGAAPDAIARLAGRAWLTEGRQSNTPESFSQALSAFDVAVRLTDAAPRELALRAEAHAAMGAYERARGDLDRAIGAAPQDPSLRFARARVLRALDRCDEAIRDYDVGLSLAPGDSRGRAARAGCKFSQGLYLGAVSDYIGSWL